MQWTAEPGAGFTTPEATPWEPLGDAAACNVAAQRDDPASTLRLVRDLIALRRRTEALTAGAYATLPAPEGAWAWQRGEGWAVALNLSDRDVVVAGIAGTVAVGTDRGRDGTAVAAPGLPLGPWEGVLVELSV
jgi:alpha-glucosidase